MIRIIRMAVWYGIACLITSISMAEAPIIDDSEAFVISKNPQAEFVQPDGATEPFAQESERKATSNNPNELLNKIDNLQHDIQELRGQLELQAHQLNLLQQQFSAPDNSSEPPKDKEAVVPAYTDDRAPPTPAVVPEDTRASHENPADEQISYLAAYELVKKNNINEGIVAMQSFIKQYPQGGYSANAHYWLGELYLSNNNLPQAIEQFKYVLQHYPSSSKASASQLKLGYALAAWGDTGPAIKTLQEVVKQYPDTRVAQLAVAKLHTLHAMDAG